jgi:hypothetical protein
MTARYTALNIQQGALNSQTIRYTLNITTLTSRVINRIILDVSWMRAIDTINQSNNQLINQPIHSSINKSTDQKALT